MDTTCEDVCLRTFEHFLETAAHRVDVFNGAEFELHVGIVVFVLVAFAGGTIGDSVDLADGTIR
jgi:hypothetical protein